MKILITSKGKTALEAADKRFGRAEYFMIYNTDTDSYETVENASKMENSGAGVRASQFVIDSQIDHLVTGSLGPKAFDIISEVKIQAWKCVEGSVDDVLKAFQAGELEPIQEAGDEVKKRGRK